MFWCLKGREGKLGPSQVSCCFAESEDGDGILEGIHTISKYFSLSSDI